MPESNDLFTQALRESAAAVDRRKIYQDDSGNQPAVFGQKCGICDHDFDPHAVIATSVGPDGINTDPRKGGIIICQERGCLCFATWSLPGLRGRKENVEVPDEEELTTIRERYWEGKL